MLQGYRGVWENNGTTLKCYPAGNQAPTAIIVGVVAAAAVLIIGLLALWQYLTTRPRWLRQRILQVGICLALSQGWRCACTCIPCAAVCGCSRHCVTLRSSAPMPVARSHMQ